RRHGLQRVAHAVPGRRPRRAGDPPDRGGDDLARRRLRGGASDRLLVRGRGPARQLGQGQGVDAPDGPAGAREGVRLLEEGRYAVKDPVAARECVIENEILRRIATDCIEDTGGLFVSTPWDDPEFGDAFLEGCQATGVPVEEVSVAEVLRREPRLDPRIMRA